MENQPKHTPGPWLMTDGDFVYALHERNGRQVNRFSAAIDHYPSQGGTAEEGRANAHLIAAAPDLLEALKYITSNCRVFCEDSMDIDDGAVYEARAAIAKAEGRGE
jgi:hypothetical protein